ncbi:hypothetical protein [Protaetiibacter mangrovi]|uniref:Uncharacterized protein n=1 Tax=Protaetiibacter mangrovi TaxID=2970926 RepID=A0ABT1ZIC1_9MICO|nr:hypothetical protein [Protaetiibacter mangrovi]MCS0500446.1 hypothetical protein [Protaetiibacter mangrovi]
MDDLFRFLMMRPADLPVSGDIRVLTSDKVDPADGPKARRQAAAVLAAKDAVHTIEQVPLGGLARDVAAAIGTSVLDADAAAALVEERTQRTAQQLVADPAFDPAVARIDDTLVAVKVLSGSAEVDARGLALAAQGFDAIRRIAEGAAEVRLRPLVVPLDPPAKPDDDHEEPPAPEEPKEPDPRIAAQIQRIDAALSALGKVPAGGFVVDRANTPRGTSRARAAAPRAAADDADAAVAESAVASNPWMLAPATVQKLPAKVTSTLRGLGIDATSVPLPTIMNTLSETRVQLSSSIAQPLESTISLTRLGSLLVPEPAATDLVGRPGAAMPTGHGEIRPVGVGDLLLVKEHVLRYEGGELAHVENVLKSEHMSRETRRLDRTETTILTESETTKEEERDTQSTDRFSLKRETDATIKDDTQFKAGIAVDAKYGPFVEVKADASIATSHSSEESTRQASEFSKDVVSRSVSKVVERVLERRSTTTISEFEEKYSHGFDNTTGAGNISGVYQWVDKVLEAQVYNYGKRMLFDVTVPEPATAFMVAETKGKLDGETFTPPVPFTLKPTDVTESNYALWAQRYDVTGIEAPPAPVKTVSKALGGTMPQDPYESSSSADIVIDDGYRAKYALWTAAWYVYDGAVWYLIIGNNSLDVFTASTYVDMAGEVGSVSISTFGWKLRDFAATIEIFCERTERAMLTWRLKTHAALTQGYLAKQQQYESKVAEAEAAAGVVISGRNPGWNARIVAAELRKQCITLLTAQQFDAFGALEVSAQGHPQPNLARTAAQMPYVRFFEQAFEWEHLIYFFYPYFWGWKPAWNRRLLLDDVDPLFADFLRAGAGRVVFPVRPGFEAAVIHYLETGKIWNGGPAPDISSSLYVPIVKEIQEATGAPGDEVPVGDPWLVRLPTTLAKLRADDALPAWKKVGEDWQPDE